MSEQMRDISSAGRTLKSIIDEENTKVNIFFVDEVEGGKRDEGFGMVESDIVIGFHVDNK